VYFEYKTQSWESNISNFPPQGPLVLGTGPGQILYEPTNLKTYSPDVWAKLGIGRFLAEAEFVAQLGSTDVLTGVPTTAGNAFTFNHYNIRKLGGSGRATFRAFEGKLRLGVESGFASGDNYPNTPLGATNLAYAAPFGNTVTPSGMVQLAPNDSTLKQFAFNRDYQIDLILWRHLVGAVTNAAYFKPFLQYDVTRSITFKVSNITSIALHKEATPGDGRVYGTEFDGELGYSTNGVFFGISYGVLFPLGAMDHPDLNPSDPSPPYGHTTTMPNNLGSASTAHTIQSRFVLAF
jgi:uncharacterized protein (TIGR04551 family)